MTDSGGDDVELARLLRHYGIADDVTGREAAWAAREYIQSVASTVVPTGPITMDHLIVCGVVARAQSLHEACVAAIESDNPHAAFTLLRAYAEQCAAVVYMADRPERAEGLWNHTEGHGVPVGVITNHAQRSGKIPNFKPLYDQLSKYAHPTAVGLYSSMRVGDDSTFDWQSAPRFKHDDDKLMAYVWCIELAQAINKFAFEFAVARGLGSLSPAPMSSGARTASDGAT